MFHPDTFIKLRPHHSDFTKLVNPKGFLERGIIKYYPVINAGKQFVLVNIILM